MLEVTLNEAYINPRIMVLGVGGGGNNALNRMIANNEFPVQYVAVNTDLMVLQNSKAQDRLPIGEKLTGGFGAGGDPEIGAASARESEEAIANLVRGSQMVIITGGMGGGTGTGAIPVIAGICQEQRILTVAIVTKPFGFEGKRKMQSAETGIEKLRECVDTLLVIPNNKLLEIKDEVLELESAFLFADSVLQGTINAITNIICNCGTVNLDFNDLRTVLFQKGEGHLGFAEEKSGNIMKAVEQALNSPLLETDLRGAEYVLFNCSGKVNLLELNAAVEHIQEVVGEDTYVMWGTVSSRQDDEDDDGGLEVTIIATGIDKKQAAAEKKMPAVTVSNEGLARSQQEYDVIYKRIKNQQKGLQRELKIPPFLQQYNKV